MPKIWHGSKKRQRKIHSERYFQNARIIKPLYTDKERAYQDKLYDWTVLSSYVATKSCYSTLWKKGDYQQELESPLFPELVSGIQDPTRILHLKYRGLNHLITVGLNWTPGLFQTNEPREEPVLVNLKVYYVARDCSNQTSGSLVQIPLFGSEIQEIRISQFQTIHEWFVPTIAIFQSIQQGRIQGDGFIIFEIFPKSINLECIFWLIKEDFYY